MSKNFGNVICADCGAEEKKNGPLQKYCGVCSGHRDMLRKRKWARENPPSSDQAKRNYSHMKERESLARQVGAKSSVENASNIAWCADPDLLWMVRISVPFTYAASKNHIYQMGRKGHRFLRTETRAMRDEITLRLRNALAGQRVAHTKVWLDLLVQKPNHKGDAVNVVDIVCDAVKAAFPVDDRWFSIRRLDWEVVKENPKLFIGIGQEHDRDQQVCSYCGGVKDLDAFNISKHNHMGRGRECKECLSAAGKIRRAQRRAK